MAERSFLLAMAGVLSIPSTSVEYNRFLFDRAQISLLKFCTNNSAIISIGNNYGFEKVFAGELRGILKPNDVFIGISKSGKSPNMLVAIQAAHELSLLYINGTRENSVINNRIL